MKTTKIRQRVRFDATPLKVYHALMSSRTHSAFTGLTARIATKVGGKISVFGGDVTGVNLKLERGKRIVQTWKPIEEGWPEDHFSEVEFRLKAKGSGCELDFIHRKIPATLKKQFADGWCRYYWEPMKAMFERG